MLCQRREGALAGKWEFPGGKLEDGETPEQCLKREIEEEPAIDIEWGTSTRQSMLITIMGTS